MDYLNTPVFVDRLREWRSIQEDSPYRESILTLIVNEHLIPMYSQIINRAVWLPEETREETIMDAAYRAAKNLHKLDETRPYNWLCRIGWNERYRQTEKQRDDARYTHISIDETFEDSDESPASLQAATLTYTTDETHKNIVRQISNLSPLHKQEIAKIMNGSCQNKTSDFSKAVYFKQSTLNKEQARRLLNEIQTVIKENLTQTENITVKSGDVILNPEHLWQSTAQEPLSNSRKHHFSHKYTQRDLEKYFGSLNIQTTFVCTSRTVALNTTLGTGSTARNLRVQKVPTTGSGSSARSTKPTPKTHSANGTRRIRESIQTSFLPLIFSGT